jgi:hypothetical protein
MSAHLRHHLGSVFQRWYFARSHHRYRHRVDAARSVHYGRVGNRYWAIVCVYWTDSPQRQDDCGTTFTKTGAHGAWHVVTQDGSYFCTPHVPRVLIRAWKLPQYC